MADRLKDKVALVVGAGSIGPGWGNGKATAVLLARQGAEIFAIDVNEAAAAETRHFIEGEGGTCVTHRRDMLVAEEVEAAVGACMHRFGRIDILVNNVGGSHPGGPVDMPEEVWDRQIDYNLKTPYLGCKYAIPVMEAQGGGVFLITTSVAAFIGFPAHALYCASKGALESLVRCLAVDHAGKVRVAGLCPGTIDTPMLAATCEGWDKPVAELYADVARRIPVRRLGQPIDIAHAAAFLLGDESGYINGTSIVLDGGTTALPPW